MADTIDTINALLARDLYPDTREELTEILRSAEAGDLSETDENYVMSLARRLDGEAATGAAKPARRKKAGDAALRRELSAAEARIAALEEELAAARAGTGAQETGMVPLYAVKAAFERHMRPVCGEPPDNGERRPVDTAVSAFYAEIEDLET